MKILRCIVLVLACIAGLAIAMPDAVPRARAGEIRFTHRQWGGVWWTDIWDVEFPNIWTPLGTIQGYYISPW